MKTAEQMYNEYTEDFVGKMDLNRDTCIELMIKFAKMHVKNTLQTLVDDGAGYYLEGDEGSERFNNKKVLNSYPLTNIL